MAPLKMTSYSSTLGQFRLGERNALIGAYICSLNKSLRFVTGHIFSVLLSPKCLDIHFKNSELYCFTVYWLWYQFAVGTLQFTGCGISLLSVLYSLLAVV
jgi:hypothetical protein